MNIRSLFYLSLAVFATTAVPGIHASQVQKGLQLDLVTEEGTQQVTLYSQTSIAILAKLTGANQEALKKCREQGASFGPRENLEAIKILHAIELNKPSLTAFMESREMGSATMMSPKRIFAQKDWESTRKALNALDGSLTSYTALYKAIKQVSQDRTNSANTTDALKYELEQFATACHNRFEIKCGQHFIKNNELDCKAVVDFMICEGFVGSNDPKAEPFDFPIRNFLRSTAKATGLTYTNNLPAYAIIQSINANNAQRLGEFQDLLKISAAELAQSSAQQPATSARPAEQVNTPAPATAAPTTVTSDLQTSGTPSQPAPAPEISNQAKLDKEAAEWNNRLFGSNCAQEPLKDSVQKAEQFLHDHEAHLSMSAAGVLKSNIQTSRRLLAATDNTLAPASTAKPAQPTPAATQPVVVTPVSVAATDESAQTKTGLEEDFEEWSTTEQIQLGHPGLTSEQLKDVHAAIQKNRKEIIEEIGLRIKQLGATDIPYLVQSTIENKVKNLLSAHSKPAKAKSFFSAHPWAKYGTYLLAGAAVVYGGYRLYKHVNVNKLVRTARLWA